MKNMNKYIVRICRYKKNSPRSLVGIIEEIGIRGKKAFTNYDELWEILNTTKRNSALKSEDIREKVALSVTLRKANTKKRGEVVRKQF